MFSVFSLSFLARTDRSARTSYPWLPLPAVFSLLEAEKSDDITFMRTVSKKIGSQSRSVDLHSE